uniref:TNFR-Cys domain-containing protein n=1 Tax=Biomphalaria glabrata TaxID=6526 RepID=A0A2C9K139_BIOGL
MCFDFWVLSGICVTMSMAQQNIVILTDDLEVTPCDPDVPSRVITVRADDEESKSSGLVCKEGEYLDWYKCSPCEEGSFRTKLMASLDRLSMCHKCQEPGMYEIVKEPCRRTRDAKITCEDGFYRYEVQGQPCASSCIRCDICGVKKNMFKPFEARECGGYQNTVCCKKDHMIVVGGRCLEPMPAKNKATTLTVENVTQRKELAYDINEPMNDNNFINEAEDLSSASPSSLLLRDVKYKYFSIL